LYGYLNLFLVGLVHGLDQPEYSREKQKEDKDQKLLVHIAEQEKSDGFEYGVDTRHQEMC
jgi:hypothetical protein